MLFIVIFTVFCTLSFVAILLTIQSNHTALPTVLPQLNHIVANVKVSIVIFLYSHS